MVSLSIAEEWNINMGRRARETGREAERCCGREEGTAKWKWRGWHRKDKEPAVSIMMCIQQ